MVWEKPTREVAKELGVSDVAIGKLCTRLQVPKPPRGYWARVESGQSPRRPPLAAFREEVDRRRRDAVRAQAAGTLSKLQQQFYRVALSELRNRGVDVEGAERPAWKVPHLGSDVAAQILLVIQNRAADWVKEGKVAVSWNHSVQSSAASLVGKLLPLARSQLLIFENEGRRGGYARSGPAVLVRLTAALQERIAGLVRIVRDQRLQHVVMPLMATDHAWTVRHLYSPESRLHFDSTLCASATEVWVECWRKAWREEDSPERMTSGRLKVQEFMPIDFMPTREIALPPVVSRATATPYADRLRGLLEAERVHEMLSRAAYEMERDIPDETLALAERIWFGNERPFRSAREAWRRLEEELDLWDTELEGERSALAQSILGINVGDIVTTNNRGRLLRLSVIAVTLYGNDKQVTFTVSGRRFRKDGTLGKVEERLWLHFENET